MSIADTNFGSRIIVDAAQATSTLKNEYSSQSVRKTDKLQVNKKENYTSEKINLPKPSSKNNDSLIDEKKDDNEKTADFE